MANTPIQDLIMYIDPAAAQKRKDRFATLKKKYIGNKDPYVDVTPQAFVNFTDQITKLGGSGCWLYFGATDNNHLTVLVVPADGNRKAIPGHYYKASAQGFVKISDSDAQALISAFQTSLLPQLEKDMGGQKESRALLFPADGMAQVAALMSAGGSLYGKVAAVRVHFGSYSPGDVIAPGPVTPTELNISNQLTVVFTLITQLAGMQAMAGGGNEGGGGDGGNFDTGIPCPPDNNC